METQSSKNRYCQTWWLVGLKVNSRVVEWESYHGRVVAAKSIVSDCLDICTILLGLN